ncbi:MAG: relaxase/mobilization nuclease domain-containing protein [Cyclobacteriaceae bacterium]
MVAKVNSGKNIRGILNYNENKVMEGVAKCIHENMFGRDVDKLTFNAKLKGFENLLNLNRRATTNAVHISLNFHASEKLSQDLLTGIASTYMERIGFGNQPYLVYQHFDAAHPHIHIITTNIRRDGQRILLYNIGKNQSEKARKEIEKQYNLVQASGRTQDQNEILSPVNMKKLAYGKSETKRSISNVVRFVARGYKYTSLPEFNAVLRQYNIMADRGSEHSRMNANKGLLYRMIDENGNKVGVPIKASSIYGKPTLPYLEKHFKLNEALRAPHRERLKKCIDEAFGGKPSTTRRAFMQALRNEGVNVLFRQNEEGRTYGITFVDNKTKVVFNGRDLGKAYGAKAIMERLTKAEFPAPQSEWLSLPHQDTLHTETDTGMEDIITDLTKAEASDHLSPGAAMRRRKKRRKRKGKSL